MMEVMRRTRKGREKIKGLLLLRARGEQIFALSPDDVDDLAEPTKRRPEGFPEEVLDPGGLVEATLAELPQGAVDVGLLLRGDAKGGGVEGSRPAGYFDSTTCT